jgi:hypothetical protein
VCIERRREREREAERQREGKASSRLTTKGREDRREKQMCKSVQLHYTHTHTHKTVPFDSCSLSAVSFLVVDFVALSCLHPPCVCVCVCVCVRACVRVRAAGVYA